MGGLTLRRVAGLVGVAIVGLVGATAPAPAASAPDLATFSGCVSAHGAVAAGARGLAPEPATVRLIVRTLATSRATGSRKVVKALRRAKGGARIEAALEATAHWCTEVGVPPITVPTTTTP